MRRVLQIGVVLVLAVAALSAVGIISQDTWETHDRIRWPMRGEFVLLADGRQLRVWCQGAGPTLVLFEGTGVSGADAYAEVLVRLASRTKVCAYDRLGYGYSIGEPRTTLEALADDLLAVAQHVAPDAPVVLVGASYGGLIAQFAARKIPERLAGLVLLDSVGLSAFKDFESAWAKLDRSAVMAGRLASLSLLRMTDPLKLGDTREAWLTYRVNTWNMAHALLATRHTAIASFDRVGPLKRDVPLRVLSHDKVGDLLGPDFSLEEHEKLEPSWQAAQKEFAAMSSNGVLMVAKGSGHFIARDAPTEVDRAVREVLGPPPEPTVIPPLFEQFRAKTVDAAPH